MTKTIFIFIASLLLLYPLMNAFGEISIANQLVFSLPFLLLLGIPHGAIDNVLYLRKRKDQNARFIGIYLVVVGLNVVLWLFLPVLAYIIFLVLSAYHFGQSQFSHYFKKQKIGHLALYLLWGLSVLSGLVLLNHSEIIAIMNQYSEFDQFKAIHNESLMRWMFGISLVMTMSIQMLFLYRRSMRLEIIMMELLVLSLILVSFYLLPFIIGFTLYFVILHSLKVLREEYGFLMEEKEVNSFLGFTRLITPFTLFSLLGIAFLFTLIYFGVLEMPYGYCLLIVISSITLPHVFVMNSFYDKLVSRSLFRKLI